ncbi:hypothetical protein TRFO_27958 [Tritrichomonas foetus]|uniref:Midasin n=1 Tax=Tritrichomonas foetus TaxID=1144522 RepID=A0A1J4K157_9EUKA|nr:hypothetical protein TRFO_27958 [Tritrichomonas foetus]|eukprot:OHT04520.1 hypothetical protein TRFO_27958 [Tritrichomonas foetus]
MWSSRVEQLVKEIPGPFDSLLDENDPDIIFQTLKNNLINPEYWEKITIIFSPIILHLVSEILLDSISTSSDDLPIVYLLSNLIPSFSSIEPLIHFYFAYRPPELSQQISNVIYLRSIFRIRKILGNSFEIKLSPFLALLNENLNEDAAFYCSVIVSIVQNSTEDESLNLINQKCSPDNATRYFLEENDFMEKKLEFENYGPMSYNCRYATSIEGIPFLRSLSSANYSSNPTTSPFARSLALALLTNKPVLVVGPAGSGKTTLIQQLASIAGAEITSLHLGSAVDAKSLLGGYICGEIPGEFRWLDGPLTSAVRTNERWIVLEQIEEASAEVLALLAPLLSERKLFVPGRSETIQAGYNIRVFATAVQPLESSLWTKIQVDFLEKEELKEALVNSHPNISVIIDRVLESWEACNLSYHELFRCCRRLETFPINNNGVSDEVYHAMYQTVVDTFTSHLPNFEKRMDIAKEIASCWTLHPSEAEAYLMNKKPQLVLSPFRIGPIELPFLGSPEPVDDFAPTFTALHHMESVARAISMNEPVLLVGETGTGKTTLVQFIASKIGADLKVINMHHQSDTLDILGGFKPVDLSKLLDPIHDRFKNAFKKTMSQKSNANFLRDTDTAFGTKQWERFLKSVAGVANKIIKGRQDLADELKSEWLSLQKAALGFLSRPEFLQRDFAFSFVEGQLATAYRTGQWILLDEVNLAPPETLLALAPIIDGHLELPNGEVVEKHPNFRLICCMNPATDVGKVNLPETLKHKFVSIFSDETSSENDIILILTQRNVNFKYHKVIFDFYSKAREMSKSVLVDGGGQRIIYSLRALTRAILYMNKAEPFFKAHRACYDALMLSFVSPLSPESAERLIAVLNSMIEPKFEDIPKEIQTNNEFIAVEGFYIKKGPEEIKERPDFILTPAAKNYLRLLAQAVFLKSSPVLLQGPTSSGKTTIVKYLADITGHKFVRINNHEHTDMSEYIGGYATNENGKFEFIDGALVRAVQDGAWVVLDELNLAPSDVLEALNRLLDQNNQLVVAETQTTYNPAPSFMLFATQNPPGAYGGRKQLSRAFRGRFVEIHVDEIPPKELTTIIKERCHLADSIANTMVNIFISLRLQRQFSQIFAGKHSFLTVRDLLRWSFREPDNWKSVVNEGFALLGERLRTLEEREIVRSTILKFAGKHASIDDVYTFDILRETVLEKYGKDISTINIVWTSGMIRSVSLLLKCIERGEPSFLVGETGTGKTTAVQIISLILERNLRILNCHQHTETSDFIGAMRPSTEKDGKLFEWKNGSLYEAMRDGEIFLMDEISLAQDSALERLNSVLEPERTLAIAEKPEYEILKANPNFVFIATMNPGGDYGKRELSASLRNRFTEIWVPSIESDTDLLEILGANSTQESTKNNGKMFLDFVRRFTKLSKTLVNISLRDILQWIRFVDLRVSQGYNFLNSYIQGAFMVFIDCVPTTLRGDCISILKEQVGEDVISEFSHTVEIKDNSMWVGDFLLPKNPNQELSQNSFVFDAPTTSMNLLRVGRALQMPLPILIEGPPGVGKTSLVNSLGQALGYNVVRINLSEHTEMLDLVGSELPVENADGGSFAWRDGAFLTALKNGDWVILDELNLASQSVLEGLNSCLDHRATLFVPELNQEFKCHPLFRIFGCQNPAGAGHGRKSLPRSFLNRFTKVYVDELCAEDFKYIVEHSYQTIDEESRMKMIDFIAELNKLNLDFEFNLRDVFRLCEMISKGISLHKALILLFVQRLRTPKIRNTVLSKLFGIFGEFNPNPRPYLISKNSIRIGDLIVDRSNASFASNELVIHPAMLPPLEAILACSVMNWPGLIVGSTATSKSSLVRIAAHIAGRKLVEFSMNNSVDTTELLGGFEQMDNHRCFEQLRAKIHPPDVESLRCLESVQEPSDLYNLIKQNEEMFPPEIVKEAEDLMKRKADPGRFEWVDGLLLQAMRNGWWIIIDNANLCPPAVLDRLNPLCEPGGYLSLNERGIVDDDIETIIPHENFRLFMTVDPHFGEVSRAMRNRSIEIYLPSYLERREDKLLIEECRALCGDHGEEFYELMQQCEHQELMHLSAWNMMAFHNFKEQTIVAQLGPDAVHFNIVKCQLTNKQNSMTRSNSSVMMFSSRNSITSPFRFTPLTYTSVISALNDAIYFSEKGTNRASIRYYLGQSRSTDFDARMIVAEKYPEALKAIRLLQTSDLLQFVEDLPLDPLLWPKTEKTLTFLAHLSLLLLDLSPKDVIDVESIDLRLALSSMIPQFYSDLIDQIKFAIQTNSISFNSLIILKAIDLFNKRPNDSLPLFRFLRAMLKNSGLTVDVGPITALLCPNNSLEAKKFRRNLGEPFSFKFENAFILWQKINEHWKRVFNESPTSYVAQAPQIEAMLETLIIEQTVSEVVEKIFEDLAKIELTKELSISFVDRVELDDFQVREEYKIVNLSTSYPCELLQDLSIRAFVYSIICAVSQNTEIPIPPDFMIPLDIVAFVKSYNKTKNTSDLLFALCELILHINKEVAVGPSYQTILTILERRATLLQSAHSVQLNKDLYKLLRAIPSVDLQSVKSYLADVFNLECGKLNINPISLNDFKKNLLEFAKSKWQRIASLSEVDDSYYHMIICQLSQILMKELSEDEQVIKEILYSKTGNNLCDAITVYNEESSILKGIHDKSITKSKYRGDSTAQFSKLRSIVNRITLSDTSEFAKSLDESGTVLLLDFPLYRDITVPIATSMRQISLAIDYNEPPVYQYMPFPFTSESLLPTLFMSNQTNWSLTFSLIGRTGIIHPPIGGFQIPRTNPEFHTISEEEKVERQIEELFNKQKKSELNIYANHFVDSVLKPDSLPTEKLLKMTFKQLKKFEIEKPSIETDSEFLPLLLYTMTKRHNSASQTGPINIYQKSSTEDIDELLKIVRIVLKCVDSLWERYPNHDTLRQIAKSADQILGQEIDAPLVNFLDGLEIMMSHIRDWQHKDRDFGEVLHPMVNLANKFLKMRLESWKQIFETRRKVLQENIGKEFYMLFCQLGECTLDKVPELFNEVRSFVELSSIGLLESNLRIVEAFAVYSLRFTEVGQIVYSLFMNLVYKYRRFLPQVEMYIASELRDLQKKMKEYVELQKWDINSDKKHFIRIDQVKRQLNKYCQQHLNVLQLQFKQLMDSFASNISKEQGIPYSVNVSKLTDLDKKTNEIMNSESTLRDRVYEARRFINTEMNITSSENETRDKFAQSSFYLYGNKPLYGSMFEKHNQLYGEALILLNQIVGLWAEPHDEIKEDARDLFGIAENMIIYVIEKRKELFIEPYIARDDVKFVLNQVILVLRAFSELESSEPIATSVNKIEALSKLQNIPKDDVIEILMDLPSKFSDNYVHYCEALFIDRAIRVLKGIENPIPPEPRFSQEQVDEHLSLMRFVVATLRTFCIALKEGYGEKKNEEENNEPQQCEGKDGTGLGEGVGDEDITNEIEDEDQLIGDNINTNQDQQNEDDVQKDGGFEVEPEFEGAADVSAHDEEEQMDDEMGDADTDDAMDSRDAEDDGKQADKETDLDNKNKEEKMQNGENDDDDNDKDAEDEDDNSKPDDKQGEMDLEEVEEDQFESSAGEWNENPEEIKMDVDDDRMLDGNSEGEEEEDMKVDEEVVNEVPPDIEDEPDEMLGMTAPDKPNPDVQEDECDDQEIQGEGKGEEAGKGEEGEGEDENDEQKNEEEEDKNEEDKLKQIEKELKIVQKKILKGENLKEGGEGGERDDNADEGVILPADEAEEHDQLEEEEEENLNKDEEGENGNEKEGEMREFDAKPEDEQEDYDKGLTHIEFVPMTDQSNNAQVGSTEMIQKEIIIKAKNITDEGRAHWEHVLSRTREGAADLCEQLRLVLEATVAAKMRGDFRTGKRLNMRKIIPFIASGFRKDKIWMRRVQPDQRNYQVFLAIDNSSSMKNNTGEMALESVCLITQALSLLGIGELCVAKFGEKTEIVHPFGEQWSEESGANLIDSFDFSEEKTEVPDLLSSSIQYLNSVHKSGSMQLCFVISDGQISNRDDIRKLIIQAQLKNLVVVLVIIDSQDTTKRSSILDMRSFANGKLKYYLDDFPFPFYVLIKDPNMLPERLADALRQWFDLANNQ